MIHRHVKIERDIGLYALRRTLPVWCFDRALHELLDLCRDASLDEVIVVVDTEEFSHGIPTLAWLDDYLPKLKHAQTELLENSVAFSLNPFVTLGHIDRGRDLRKTFPDFQMLVGHDGVECRACACPLSTAWQNHTRGLWQRYASLQPRVIWVEDDLRSFNHLPVRYGCFCALHLDEFSKRVNEKVTRQKLVNAILQPGTPHPFREKWLRLQADSLLIAAGVLEKAVHELSPRTQLGMMSSGPELHCIEFRDWTAHAKALGGKQAIYSRPTLACYSESSLKELTYGARQLKLTRHVLPKGTIEQTEVENIPFGPYCKSAKFTFLQIALSLSHGCHGATMNLFDHLGTPIDQQPAMARMLGESKPFLDAISRIHPADGAFRGIGLLYHPAATVSRHLKEHASWDSLVPRDHQWSEVFSLTGIATTYDPAPVVAADGEVLRAFTDGQIREFLSRGALLDLTAAEVLVERGFGELLGVEKIERMTFGEGLCIAAEELHNESFGGASERYVTLTLPHLGGGASIGLPELSAGAVAASRLVDPDRNPLRDFTWTYENALGGRIAVVPVDLLSANGPAFLNPSRRIHLLELLRWLSRGELPASVEGGANGLCYRMDTPDRTLLGLFNLDHDVWPGVTWRTDLPLSTVSGVEWLDERGRLQPFGPSVMSGSGDRLTLSLRTQVDFERPLILSVRLRRAPRGRITR